MGRRRLSPEEKEARITEMALLQKEEVRKENHARALGNDMKKAKERLASEAPTEIKNEQSGFSLGPLYIQIIPVRCGCGLHECNMKYVILKIHCFLGIGGIKVRVSGEELGSHLFLFNNEGELATHPLRAGTYTFTLE